MLRSYSAGVHIAASASIDLQTHTYLSDGTWMPESLIEHFVAHGFASAAITDHDRVDTMNELQHIAHEKGFPLLVATEMTTRWRDSMVDILCFGFEKNPAPLSQLCSAIHQAQSANSQQVYQYLLANGYLAEDDPSALAAILNATTSRQPHMVFDLFLQHNPHLQEDFSPLKAAGYQLCTNPTLAVVEATHASGGVALIAHPGRTDGYATFDAALLDQFRAEIPIDGIEVYYPRHKPEQVTLYRMYAEEHAWLMSAGSDSHKPQDPPIAYPAYTCKALLARLEIEVI